MICNNNSKSDLPITNNKLEYLTKLEKHTEMNTEINKAVKKYFLTFPYPYMNGKLHLGHLYSLSKVDFMGYYKRLCGYNVLFPFAFHCTGMPISASAKKLQEEINGNKVDVSVIDILKQFGFNDPKPFIDPEHWIRTFPDYAKKTLKAFHAGIDWRRSFITTELNIYYDSFIKFQFRRLRAAKLLKFGKRYSIYCRIDNQACLDHDRRRGEGVKPIEVILKKILTSHGILLLRCKVTEKTNENLERIVLGREEVFIKFTVSNIIDNSENADNKKIIKETEKNILEDSLIERVDKILSDTINKNSDQNMLIKTKPTTVYIIEKLLYENLVHQVDGIKEIGKITAEEIISIIEKEEIPVTLIDGFNSRAVLAREDSKPPIHEHEFLLRIKNEEKRLLETSGFVKVYEPEQKVISRSGDECVVSLLDQWYIDYGNADWKEAARRCLAQMELSGPTRLKFEEAIEWISKWGFSRSFGLGTHVPWDEKYLIDSLSDSTIYMSFYTFKHLLSNGLAGEDPIVPFDILGDDLWEYIYGDVMRSCNCRCIYESGDNEIYISSSSDSIINENSNYYSSDSTVCGNSSSENRCDNKNYNLFNCNCNYKKNKLSERLLPYEKILKKCKDSLNYFYPVDLRVSGKDLIGNHLIFYIFNHVALFREEFWPRRIFTNGHLMLNSAKMSKSEGNFMSAEEALNKFGTSATRLCLASCGDTNEDANFEEENANACVLKLFSLAKKILETNNETNKSNTINSVLNRTPQTYEEFIETLLAQSLSYNIRLAIEAYELMSYRDVAKYAFYESQHAVEQYFVMGGRETPFISSVYKAILQIIYPIVPSFSRALLENKYNGDLQLPKPFTDRVDAIAAFDYARTIINRIITGAKGRTKCTLIISTKYPNWKIDAMACIDTITTKWNKKNNENDLIIGIMNNNNIKKQKSEIISTLSTIFRDYRLNVDKSLKFAMDYFKDPSKYAIKFDELTYLKLLRPFIEKHANISFKLEIGETGEPMKPTIIFY